MNYTGGAFAVYSRMTPMASAARADFPSVSEGPASLLDRLRRRLRAVEASTGLSDAGAGVVMLGVPPIDSALGGGLACGALHEIAAARETETAAATGFALALAIRRNADHLVFIAEELSLAESGVPYGPGLDQAGLAPEQLITVTTAHGRDVLWAMEEALRCPAVGAVIGEIRARDIDAVVTRRLSLAAAAGNALALLVRTAPDDEPSAAATRWVIGAARALIERPRLAARLVRNRRGHPGAWIVEWNSVEQRFELATNSEPVAGAALDRPHRAAVA